LFSEMESKPAKIFPELLTPQSFGSKSMQDSQHNGILNELKPKTLHIQSLGPSPKEYRDFIQKNPDQIYSKCFVTLPNINKKSIDTVTGPTGNMFFDSFFLAWTQHGEIVLCPDDIWTQIAIEVSLYIDKNAEKLRRSMVDHTGQKALVVVCDKVPGLEDHTKPEFRWDVLLTGFSKLIEGDLKTKIAQIFVKPFSTTCPVERAASEICLMSACKKYYKYVAMLGGCGIEKIHFLGTSKDWDLLKNKLSAVLDFAKETNSDELEQYLEKLLPVIENMIIGYHGKLDKKFWNSVIIDKHEITLPYGFEIGRRGEMKDLIGGWIQYFFLYNKDWKIDFSDLSYTTDFVPRYAKAPIEISYIETGKSYKVEAISGFESIGLFGKIYRPIIAVGFIDAGKLDDNPMFNLPMFTYDRRQTTQKI
jgi:hypothetical protein